MASQDPSTAYGAAPEKKSTSWFPSFSLPKLPNFVSSTTPAPAPAPAPAPSTEVTQPGGRRRKNTKKAGRRTRRGKKGGLTPAEGVKFSDSDIRYMSQGTKAEFPPTQVRKGKGGRRTRRAKKHSRK